MHYISGYAVGWFPNHSIRPSATASADSVVAYPLTFLLGGFGAYDPEKGRVAEANLA